jgi:hypothetical protein
MPLKVAAGRLEFFADSVSCQLQDGPRTIACTVAYQVLRDLGDYHFGRAIPEQAVFSECLPQIERLANAKFRGRKFDEDGGLSISPADLARYGFGSLFQFDIAAE